MTARRAPAPYPLDHGRGYRYAHDEEGKAQPGDKVRIMETRPLSKLKRWRVVEILKH